MSNSKLKNCSSPESDHVIHMNSTTEEQFLLCESGAPDFQCAKLDPEMR